MPAFKEPNSSFSCRWRSRLLIDELTYHERPEIPYTGWPRVALNTKDGPQKCLPLDGLSQSNMRFVCEYVTALVHDPKEINRCLRYRNRQRSPTCSVPLKTYSRQPNTGLRASGGSLYFNTVLSPLACFTVLVSAARRPDGPKFGFALLTGDADRDLD
jgi:hypothetical protein